MALTRTAPGSERSVAWQASRGGSRSAGAPPRSISRRAPFALGDADELGDLVKGAGFRDVTVRSLVNRARFPSPEMLVEYQLAATPLSTLGGVTDQARAAIIQDLSAALQVYVDDDGLTFPMEAHFVAART